MSKWTKTMRDALAEMSEAFSKKQIKMAIGIASDPRYKQGNYSGAFKQIEKIKKGLASHPQVAAVLKRQNEMYDSDTEHTKDPKSHVKLNKETGKYCVYDMKDKKVAEFDTKDEAEAYAVKNHDALMNEQQLNCGCGKTPCETYGSIEEGKMKELHGYIAQGMSAEEIAKKMKLDLKTIKALMKEEVEHEGCDCCEESPCVCEDDCECKSLDENRAARDAKRAMAKDKDMQQKPFDKDDKATAIDIQKGKQNIVVQLKKAMNLGGSKPVTFDSGPSKKIDPKFARAALDKLNTIKRSDDKLKFQAKLQKSYKDMLKALKEDFVLDEGKAYKFAAVDKKGLVIGFASDEKDAKDMARRNKGRVVTLTKPLPDNKKSDMMVNRPLPDKMDKFPTNTSATQGKRMEEVELDEMKMNDPKLNKIFDKLKKGSKVKLKTSSTISQGKDYVEYIVKSKNTVNKGRVEKITLATVGNEKAVKKFLYKRDGQVTFAIGDMGASIDDIKESTNEVPENMAAYTAAITKQLGEK